jgi:hypothetical protein
MAWTTIPILLASLWLGSTFYSLARNYLSARKIGAPIFILPWNTQNPIWMIFSVPLVPSLEKYLPASWYRVLNMSTYGFEFRLKEDLFGKDDNDAVVLVTSGPVELSIRDPELASEVMRRLKDFPGTDAAGFIMGIFGPNLLTSDGDDWTRQRKLVSPPFHKIMCHFRHSSVLDEPNPQGQPNREYGSQRDVVDKRLWDVLSTLSISRPKL